MAGFRNWEKWMIMSVIILALSAIVIYFNVRVFGWEDGAPYIGVVSFIVLMSFIVTRHLKRNAVTTNFLRAAFIFEILLCVVLGVNVAYSLSVMREMSVAGQSEAQAAIVAKTETDTAREVAKFKSPQAQRQFTRNMSAAGKGKGTTITRFQVFAERERILFWIMIAELATAMLAFFVLLSLSIFDQDGNGIPDFLESSNDADDGEIAELHRSFPPPSRQIGFNELTAKARNTFEPGRSAGFARLKRPPALRDEFENNEDDGPK